MENSGDGSIDVEGEPMLPMLPELPLLLALPEDDDGPGMPKSYGVGGELIADDTDEADDSSGVSGIIPAFNVLDERSNMDVSACAMR
jgi:hypothetical protein